MTKPTQTSRSVQFVNPKRLYQTIREDIDTAYEQVMAGGDFIDRDQLRRFEQNLAEFVGTKYAIGLNSGYDALHLSLRAAGVGPGDEVIIPAHTFVATCSAVVHVGATPVLVDVSDDFNMDVAQFQQAIGPRTKAVIPVHLSGWMCDMPAIIEIAKQHRLVVIEDACQSLGSRVGGRRAGASGLTGCWSFYPFKILGAYGDGGAITTDDPDVAEFVRRMRYNGEDRNTGEYHGHGFTCLLDNLQAAFLDVKLRFLPSWIERRKTIAQRYRRGLSDLGDLMLPHYHRADSDHVYQNYTIRSRQGNDFSEHMKAHGVQVLTQFRKPYYRHAALGLQDSGFPVTEAISREVCSLPMCVELDDDEVDYVVEAARSFYRLDREHSNC